MLGTIHLSGDDIRSMLLESFANDGHAVKDVVLVETGSEVEADAQFLVESRKGAEALETVARMNGRQIQERVCKVLSARGYSFPEAKAAFSLTRHPDRERKEFFADVLVELPEKMPAVKRKRAGLGTLFRREERPAPEEAGATAATA